MPPKTLKKGPKRNDNDDDDNPKDLHGHNDDVKIPESTIDDGEIKTPSAARANTSSTTDDNDTNKLLAMLKDMSPEQRQLIFAELGTPQTQPAVVEQTPVKTDDEDKKKGMEFSSPLFSTKRKAYALELSDEDNTSGCPNLGQLTFLQPPKSGRFAARIIRVVPTEKGGISGWILYVEGFAEKKLADIFIGRNKSTYYKRFCYNIGEPAERLMTVLLPNPPESEPERARKNKAGFNVKAIAFVCPQDAYPSDESVKEWYNDCFMKHFKCVIKDDLREEQWPELPENETEVFHHWTRVLTPKDFSYVWSRHVTVNKLTVTQAKWLKESASHLYSVYVPGKVPMNILTGIKTEILAPEDQSEIANRGVI